MIKQMLMKRRHRKALKEDLTLAIKKILLLHEVELKRGTDRGIERAVRRIARQCILRADEETKLKIAESILKEVDSMGTGD